LGRQEVHKRFRRPRRVVNSATAVALAPAAAIQGAVSESSYL
jgi:hypothetical protein